MSTLKTTNLQNASAASPAFVLASDGSATANLSSLNGGPIAGNRNRIINGDMRIDQRNAGASISVVAGLAFPVDRTQVVINAASGSTAQRTTQVPAGFTNSLAVTVGTGASPTAAQQGRILHVIEAFNSADLAWGTSSALSVTLSFWVRSSVTGAFAGGLYGASTTQSYVFTYAIASANTWEYKTVTIPGPTSGTWATDNSAGVNVNFDLGTGSNFQGTAGSWVVGTAWATSGSVKLCTTNGATFYITGVQLEPGSVATPFERRSYGAELVLCQRYYETGALKLFVGSAGTPQVIFQNYRVFKRVAATLSYSAPPAGGYSPPSSLEWTDISGFSANSGSTAALQFSWTASAEL